MAIPSTDYDFHTYAIPWTDSTPEAPVLIEIRMPNEIKLQLRTPQGNEETNYPAFTAPDFQHSFTIPLHILASVYLCDCYLFQQLSRLGFVPNLCNLMKQGILNSTFNPCWSRFRNLRGIQVTAVFKVTTTIELVYRPTARYDQMVSLLSEEVVIMDDDGGSVQRRRGGATKAAIDGLNKVVFFNGGGGGEEDENCAVCLQEFGEGTEVTCMPCSHLFHHRCIVPWLQASNTCPMCRFELPSQ